MAALSRGFYINFVILVLQKVAAGLLIKWTHSNENWINEMVWKIGLDFPGLHGHYSEVHAWPY